MEFVTAFVLAVAPFLINGAVAAVKWFFKWLAGTDKLTATSKRGILAFVALIGSIAYSQYMGTPIEMDSISSLASVALDAFVAFLLGHASYVLFWKKPVE